MPDREAPGFAGQGDVELPETVGMLMELGSYGDRTEADLALLNAEVLQAVGRASSTAPSTRLSDPAVTARLTSHLAHLHSNHSTFPSHHSRALVRDLTDACPVDRVLLVREAERRHKRDGSPYLRLALADRSGTVPAVLWDAADAPTLEPGDAVHVSGQSPSTPATAGS